jgi:hypothetical protein
MTINSFATSLFLILATLLITSSLSVANTQTPLQEASLSRGDARSTARLETDPLASATGVNSDFLAITIAISSQLRVRSESISISQVKPRGT